MRPQLDPLVDYGITHYSLDWRGCVAGSTWTFEARPLTERPAEVEFSNCDASSLERCVSQLNAHGGRLLWHYCPNPACRGEVLACVRQCYHCGAYFLWAEWVPVLEETIEVVPREVAQNAQMKAFEFAGKVLNSDFRFGILMQIREAIPELVNEGGFRKSVSTAPLAGSGARCPRAESLLRAPVPEMSSR